MASILKERLEAGICLIAGLLLVGWPTVAKAEFNPGQQHAYPFYYPDDDLVGLPSPQLFKQPQPDNNTGWCPNRWAKPNPPKLLHQVTVPSKYRSVTMLVTMLQRFQPPKDG